jgi:hypothetical protein
MCYLYEKISYNMIENMSFIYKKYDIIKEILDKNLINI